MVYTSIGQTVENDGRPLSFHGQVMTDDDDNDDVLCLLQGPRVYNQLSEATGLGEEATNVIVKRTVRWMGVAQQPGWYQ